MSYFSMNVLATSGGELRARLLAYPSLFFLDEDGRLAGRNVEWVEIPNPIMLTLSPDPAVPPLPDPRRVFLVKISGGARQSEEEGEEQSDGQGNPRHWIMRTKIGRFIRDNSVGDPIVGFHNGAAVSYPARRVGQRFWVTFAELGSWQ